LTDDLEILVKVLPPTVEWRKVERGIAVRPVNQPAMESVVEMPADVRDRVWGWLQNPRVVSDKESMELRKPVGLVMLEIAKVIMQYGSPLQREVFKRILEELSKSRQD
jgi:hypothetical protein